MKDSIFKVGQEVNGIMTPEIPLIPETVAGVKQPLICLNDRDGEGKWEFKKTPVENIPAPDAVDQDYDFTALDKEGWAAVAVPGELEMQGFELKNNTEYYYRTTVHIPEDFAGYRCMLRFDGVHSNARVWVGNRYIRNHQGGFTTWYCDITEYAVPGGEVQLIVGIADLEGDQPGLYNHYEQRPLRDPSFASNYAHHNMGGILRDVSLMALPGTYLARLHTEVVFDENFRDAELRIGAQVNLGEEDVTVSCTLLDAEGRECLGKEFLMSGEDRKKTEAAVLQVKEPKHWDAEQFYKDDDLIDEYVIKNGNLPAAGPELQSQWSGRTVNCPEPEGTGKKEFQEYQSSAELTETDKEIIVMAGQSKFYFDKDAAQMTMGQCQGKTLLCGGPHLVLTGTVLGEWRKTVPGVRAVTRDGHVIVTLAGRYSNGYEIWYTVTIDGDGRFVTSYQVKGGWTDKAIKELGIRYDLMPGAEKISWQREGLYSCYPEDHIGRNSGIACRRNALARNSGYMTVPEWDWKEDMWDDFLYAREDAENGLVTRDFKALRENIRYFDVHFAESAAYVRAEDRNCRTAARISVSVDGNGEERTSLLVLKRWAYPDLGWGNEEERRFNVGCGAYGSVAMRFGA